MNRFYTINCFLKVLLCPLRRTIASDETLPKAVDAVVVGGGIVARLRPITCQARTFGSLA